MVKGKGYYFTRGRVSYELHLVHKLPHCLLEIGHKLIEGYKCIFLFLS